MRRLLSIASLAGLASVSAHVDAQPTVTMQTGYDLVELSTASGRSSYCTWISPTGAVAGADKPAGTSDTRAVLWTPGGVQQVVANAGDPSVTVGIAGAEPVGYGKQLGVFTAFKGNVSIPGGGLPLGVGPQGTIVGIKPRQGGTDAYVFNPAHTMKSIAGWPVSGAYDVNTAGTVVGYLATATAQGSPTKPARWSKEGGDPVVLPGKGAQGLGSAFAINDKGVVVGNVGTGDAQRAAKWEGDQLAELGTLGGASGATAINGGGTIVGWSKDGSGRLHGVIFRGGKVLDLNTQIHRAAGVDLAHDWLLQSAGGINDKGEICGYASKDGQNHAVLLRPTTRTISVATLEEIAKALDASRPAQQLHVKGALALP